MAPRSPGRKRIGRQADLHRAGTEPAAVPVFSSPSPRIAIGSTRADCFTSSPIPGRNGASLPSADRVPSGKPAHETPVQRLAGVGEAALKVPLPRQRKHVEERSEQEIEKRAGKKESSLNRGPLCIAEVPIVVQHLARHGHRNPPPNRGRQRVFQQWPVKAGHVVGYDQHRLVGLGLPASTRPRVRQQPHQRPHHRLDKGHAHPSERPATASAGRCTAPAQAPFAALGGRAPVGFRAFPPFPRKRPRKG